VLITSPFCSSVFYVFQNNVPLRVVYFVSKIVTGTLCFLPSMNRCGKDFPKCEQKYFSFFVMYLDKSDGDQYYLQFCVAGRMFKAVKIDFSSSDHEIQKNEE